MPYATQADIQMAAGGAESLLQLADWDHDGAIDPDVIARAQDAADALVDAYLRNRYQAGEIDAFKVTPPRELRDIAAAEAVYWMRSSKQQTTEEDREVRGARVMILEQIRSGTLRFDTATRSGGSSTIIESTSDITRDKLKGFW